ncbi:hypothetical protein BX600DRAFT_441339 [Xylariales sp. PMI_506]|nr:hypothetical protein BX600DRAFT_441339 [Xylariales sp. PMI_506]
MNVLTSSSEKRYAHSSTRNSMQDPSLHETRVCLLSPRTFTCKVLLKTTGGVHGRSFWKAMDTSAYHDESLGACDADIALIADVFVCPDTTLTNVVAKSYGPGSSHATELSSICMLQTSVAKKKAEGGCHSLVEVGFSHFVPFKHLSGTLSGSITMGALDRDRDKT